MVDDKQSEPRPGHTSAKPAPGRRLRRLGILAAGAALALAVPAFGTVALWGDGAPSGTTSYQVPKKAIPMAVLGDSNSHSYQDRSAFPLGGSERGGALRQTTLQWTEALTRLRGDEIDLGPWVLWGRPWWVAWARELVGLQPSRAPKKEDYLYNFANSGAGCRHLIGERRGQPFRQAPRLVALMDQQPEQWRRGVVVISIGPNDWNPWLELQSRDPSAPELRNAIDYCSQQIRAAIALIHASHPSTRILISGLGNEADDPENFDKYRDGTAMANIRKALAGANAELRKIAAADPLRIAYVDYNEWFIQRWGQRGPDGEPTYKSAAIGPTLRITNTAGDEPHNALLGDHHGGTALNAMWAQSLVQWLRESFALPLTPISDKEVARLVAG
ncbi:SGNH/GDSL hydrolase family protein [Variovorax sp. M-6]|uniref:SGNH/GDSL hydrolase family protein n=1 Tax=Variovorax sp. M-6 TaxID=3233041 RepID=UPI003F979168